MSTTRRLQWFVLVASLLAGAPGFPADADGKVIPSETCRGLWIVPVSYGDGPDRTLRMVLDTGAASTAVDPEALERILGRKVKPGRSVRLRDGKAGPLTIKKIKVKSHPMDHLSHALGAPIDGILGFPTFESVLLTLDYHASEIRLREGTLPAVDDRTVFRDVGKVRPYLAVPVGDETLAVLVDSGSSGGWTLRTTDALRWETPPRPTNATAGYSSIRIVESGRLAFDLPIGPLVAERPIVAMTDGTRLAGVKVMHRFVWTFDQRTRRIRMLPDHDGPIRSDALRGTGVAFKPADDGFEILRVFPDGPGSDADLREGDVVVAIDGTPVFERGCRSVYEDLGQGATTMTVVRGGASFDVTVEPRTLVP